MTINISSAKILKIIQLPLLVVILGLLVWTAPWDSNDGSAKRTVTVTGKSTIKATPDEFTFYPYFQESGTDQDEIKEELTTKATSVVEKLKELGVEEKHITLDVSSYDRWYYSEGEEGTLNARLQIVVSDKDLVTKVQNYLLTLDVKGQITPQATFSKAKKAELDAQAVEEASNDAVAKAMAQASLFDAELGKAITISQGSDSVFYDYSRGNAATLEQSEGPSSSLSLPVLPGQNEYTQTMTVTYELR